jgi:cytidylate kinase
MERSEVSKLEERVPSLVERIAESMRMSTPEYVVPVADASITQTAETRIADVTQRVMQEAVQQGNAVLVGRGATALLGNRTDTLHVFCYAAMPQLVAYAIAHRGLDPATAAHEVEQRNKQREQYVKRHWGRDWRSFENYHVCVDTGRLGIDAAVSVVLAAARERFNLSS